MNHEGEKVILVDSEQEMKDYYKNFYNIELTDEDIVKIFHPTREAAGA